MQRCGAILNFWGMRFTPLPLKNFMHPSCQVLGAAPDLSVHLLVCHTSVSHHNNHYQFSFQVLFSFSGEALPLWASSIFTYFSS